MLTKNLSILLLLVFTGLTAGAQTSYFQQEVNYTISVSLNDEDHILSGTIDIEYTNNAPEALDIIWMHLWGNAFSKKNTAFTKQKLSQRDTRFYLRS